MRTQGAEAEWKPQEIKLLGKHSDETVARRLGRTLAEVRAKRWSLHKRKWQRPRRVGMEPDKPEKVLLRFGPYHPPEVSPGEFLDCAMRGPVEVGDYSDGLIPWPMKQGTRSPILCGDLVDAVIHESELGVAHHWGFCLTTVLKWRRALGVEPITPGTHQLKCFATKDAMTPVLRFHLAEEHIGKPTAFTPGGRARLLRSLHRPKSERWHQSMAKHFEARRGKPVDPNTRVWTPDEEKVVGTKPDREVARMLGRSVAAVTARRIGKGIAYVNPTLRPWTEKDLRLLRRLAPDEVSKRTGHSLVSVKSKRRKVGIIIRPPRRPWTAEDERTLGKKPDTQLARLLGRDRSDVRLRRIALGIEPAREHALYEYWTPEEDRLLGTASDKEVARQVGRSAECVQRRRLRLGLPSHRATKKMFRETKKLEG